MNRKLAIKTYFDRDRRVTFEFFRIIQLKYLKISIKKGKNGN